MTYFDMLSGDPILFPGVGHIRSPKLSEIKPDSGIGSETYYGLVQVLIWDKKFFEKNVRIDKLKLTPAMISRMELFDIVAYDTGMRDFLRASLSFFITEQVVWDKSAGEFATIDVPETGEPKVVGRINSENYEGLKKQILRLNYIGLEKVKEEVKYSSDKAKELWEEAQKYMERLGNSQDDRIMDLGNIVSKICAVHPSYNLFNIFNLTVFQLYDTFFQTVHLHTTNLSERIFSNHGGKDFDLQDWLKPIETIK